MKKILKSLGIIAAVAAITGGATWAWDLQKEKITGVTFAAGSADLKIDANPLSGSQSWQDGFNASGIFTADKLIPGAELDKQIVNIKNVGDTDGKTSVRLELVSNKENDRLTPEIEAGDTTGGDWGGELAGKMRVKISYKKETDSSWTEKYDYTLAEYAANPSMLSLGDIGHGTAADENLDGVGNVKFEWSIPANAGNTIMTDSVGVNVIFGLE